MVAPTSEHTWSFREQSDVGKANKFEMAGGHALVRISSSKKGLGKKQKASWNPFLSSDSLEEALISTRYLSTCMSDVSTKGGCDGTRSTARTRRKWWSEIWKWDYTTGGGWNRIASRRGV